MGYSVAVGDFYDEGVQGAAVGMPRGAGLEGKVRSTRKYVLSASEKMV